MANGKQKKSKKKIYIFSGLGVLVIALVVIMILGSGREEIVHRGAGKTRRARRARQQCRHCRADGQGRVLACEVLAPAA